LLVTLAYLTVYYVMQLYVLRTKKRLFREYHARGERFDRYFGEDRVMLAADRCKPRLRDAAIILCPNAGGVAPKCSSAENSDVLSGR
jgi:hypothetical protein